MGDETLMEKLFFFFNTKRRVLELLTIGVICDYYVSKVVKKDLWQIVRW